MILVTSSHNILVIHQTSLLLSFFFGLLKPVLKACISHSACSKASYLALRCCVSFLCACLFPAPWLKCHPELKCTKCLLLPPIVSCGIAAVKQIICG